MSKNVWEWWTIMSNRVCTSGSMVVGTFAQACNLNSTSRNRITKSAEHRQPYQIPTTNPTYQFLDEFAVIVAKLGCRTLGRWWFVPYWQQIGVHTPHTQKNTSFKFKSHQCMLHWKLVYKTHLRALSGTTSQRVMSSREEYWCLIGIIQLTVPVSGHGIRACVPFAR